MFSSFRKEGEEAGSAARNAAMMGVNQESQKREHMRRDERKRTLRDINLEHVKQNKEEEKQNDQEEKAG